eukprot:2153028-Prymnesium_polylepis.1
MRFDPCGLFRGGPISTIGTDRQHGSTTVREGTSGPAVLCARVAYAIVVGAVRAKHGSEEEADGHLDDRKHRRLRGGLLLGEAKG